MSLRGVLPVAMACVLALMGSACSMASSAAPPKATSPASSKAGQTVYPLRITQPDGTTAVIKAPPTRVVTVDNPEFAVDYLLALGVQPIGGEIYPITSSIYPKLYKDIHLTNFQNLGTAPSSPDLEAIAGAHPDLIVGVSGTATADLKQLEAIAPVVDIAQTTSGEGQTGIQSMNWYAELELLAKVLNRQAQANAFIAKFQAAAAKVRPELTGKSMSYVTIAINGQDFFGYGPKAYGGTLFTYLGLTVPPLPSGGKILQGSNASNGYEEISIERAGELTAQYLFAGSGSPGGYQAFIANPVVAQVPAVKAGRVFSDTPGTPISGFPTEGCIAQLDDIPLFAQALLNAGK